MVSSAMEAPSKITIKRVERLSPQAVRITLDPGMDAPKWKNIPGGYLTFCLPVGENVLHRSYSLVQGLTSELPQVIVKETRCQRQRIHQPRILRGFQFDGLPSEGAFVPPCLERGTSTFHHVCRRDGHHPLVQRVATCDG